MNRPHGWGWYDDAEVRDREAIVLSNEQIRDLPVVQHAMDLRDAPHGTVALWWDTNDAPRRSILLHVTVIRGPWKPTGRPGGRVACSEDDPHRWRDRVEAAYGSAFGYRLVHAECPLLDVLARRTAR